MTFTEQLLLVVVSFATLLLLVFTIAIVWFVVVILRKVKSIAQTTQDSVEKFADIVEEVKENVASSANVANFLHRFVSRKRK